MTAEEFELLKQKSQPHEVFKLDWKNYYSIDFMDTFLPNIQGYQCKGVKFYDGARLLEGMRKSPQSLLPLTDSNELISLVTATYPKGVEAEFKKNRIQLSRHEIASFIEIDQNEKATISFKFGSNSQVFLNSQNISTNEIENREFETDINNIQSHFNRTLSHTNMMEFVLDTIGANLTDAYGNGTKGKLEAFLKKNKIESFIYKNTCSGNTDVVIRGRIVEGWLELTYINLSQLNAITRLNVSQEEKVFAFKLNDIWIKSELGIVSEFNNSVCPDISTPIVNDEIEHISQITREHIGFTKLEGNEKQYTALNKEIQKQLDNPFYNDVNLCVNLQVADNSDNQNQLSQTIDGRRFGSITNNNKIFNSTFQNKEGVCDITLNILLDEKGRLQIKHQVADSYLQEFEEKWEEEIRLRGLEDEIDIKELRAQVLQDFISAETEHSFYETFVQDVKATFSSKVGGYIEAIQATQKVAKNVWKEGTINESTWFGKSSEHPEWPTYMQFNPVVGGATDGVIDEIVGIPMAIKGVYGIATDKKQREALSNLFTKEGLKQLLDGLKKDTKETLSDEDKLGHFSGKTTVSVASMMVPGLQITKIGKVGEVLDTATDGIKNVADSKIIKEVDKIKTETKLLPEKIDGNQRKAFKENRQDIKDFLGDGNNKEIIEDLGEDLSKVLKKGEDATVLKKARNLPRKSKGLGKEIKGNWLKGTNGNAGLFPKSVADKLKGQDFSNFGQFREKFWKTVAEDPNLSRQFGAGSITRMKNGNSPFVHNTQNLGGQKNYVLHHKTPINQGGGVYDMDNMYIVTPRFHKEILAPEYHFGYGYK